MLEEFMAIFGAAYSWLTITLLLIGMVFCVVEAIVPGFGVFGFIGILAEIAAVIVHAVLNDGTGTQIAILLIIVVLFSILLFLAFIRSAKKGIIGKSPLVENKTAIPVNYGIKEEQSLESLVKKEGIVTTECRPLGKARIGDKIYEVSSKGALIKKGEIVVVTDVKDQILYVGKITF